MRIRKFSAVAFAALSVMSCSDFDNGFDVVEFKHQELVSVYTQNFVSRYGEIAPNHNWGFGDITGEMSTRGNVSEKNMWQDYYHLNIPGFPDIYMNADGTSGNNGYSMYGGGKHEYLETANLSTHVPAGDVTDEEIEYVSTWFRTHYKPSTQVVHLTDFYLQEVSSDFDRNADGTIDRTSTRREFDYNNGNVWKESKDVINGDFGYDQLKAKTIEINPTTLEEYDHIYNFNSDASNKLHRVAKVSMDIDNPYAKDGLKTAEGATVSTSNRMCDFFTSSGTEDFSAHYSNDQKWRNEYVLVHLTFTGKSGRLYDGYYIGFDYEFKQLEETFYEDDKFGNKAGEAKKYVYKDFDGYYSNWILKLTPAEPIENNGYTRRIFCEDLGNTYDFDFNDVVFDVTYNTDVVPAPFKVKSATDANIDVTITIRAAGGTLPIYVGVDPSDPSNSDYEIHHLLGNTPSHKPVNVGLGTKEAPIANYHIKVSSINPDSIPVYVVNGGHTYKLNTANANLENYNDGKKGSNAAPQKICVPNTVRWMKEEQQIDWGYCTFGDWVRGIIDPNLAGGSNDNWYNVEVEKSLHGGKEEDYRY